MTYCPTNSFPFASFRSFASTLVLALAFAGSGEGVANAAHGIFANAQYQVKISREAVAKIAIQQMPGGKIQSIELQNDYGKYFWLVDISVPKTNKIAEVRVNAKTGDIVSTKAARPTGQ